MGYGRETGTGDIDIGYYSLFDKSSAPAAITFNHIRRSDSLLNLFPEDKTIKILKQFSKGFYVMTRDSTGIYFNDVRFGQMNGWDDPNSAFPFSYKLGKNADNSTALNRGKFKFSLGEAFRSLYNRIKGR
jgi:inner membrane protein